MGIRNATSTWNDNKVENFIRQNALLTVYTSKSCPDQQLVQPVSAVEAALLQPDLHGQEGVVELSDRGRQLRELQEQSQPEPEVPVRVECGDSTLTILLELKLAQFQYW